MSSSSPSRKPHVDVLLTHSNHVFHDQKQTQKMQPYPPLQTLLAAAVLREWGASVVLCDITLESPRTKFESYLDEFRPRFAFICEDDFNFITKMCLGKNRELAFWMASCAQRYGATAIVHGSDASDHIQEYLSAGFDFIVLGEVETAIVELTQQNDPRGIPGIVYLARETGQPRYNEPRPLRTDLDSLPLPAWDLVDMDRYRECWLNAHGYFSLNMVSSRGCPYKCNWCAKPIYGNSYHTRSPQNVAAEMHHLKEQYKPGHIWFADDIFALSGRWARDFAHAVEKLDAQIPFRMQSRCDLMTRDSVKALKRAGCCEVWMGAESGSQRILDAMDKGIQVQQIYAARENLSRNNIRAGLFLQFGYLGETWTDIEATIRMVRDVTPDDVGVSVSYPLPGTRFYQLVSSDMKAKSNWSESGDLAMMFRGAYSSQLYKALADAIHLEVRQPGDKYAVERAWNRVYELEGTEISGRTLASQGAMVQ